MKSHFAFVFLAFFMVGFFPVTAQVTSVPRFPTDTDSVTLYFNAAEGNGALANFNGPVYGHFGVLTNLSTSPTNWRHVVPSTWGVATPQTLMTPLGNNLYRFGYRPRSFHAVPAAETVQSLAFVFRNTDGSIVGRAADGSDIYVPIYPAGQLQARIFAPSRGQLLVPVQTNVPFFGAASQVCSLSLFVNGVLQQSVLSDTLSINLQFPQANNYELVFRATSGTSTVSDTIRLVCPPGSVIAPLPAGVQDGVNEINDSTVQLVLYAPFKQNVFVLGDFNNWTPDVNYFMNRTPDSNWYWLTIHNLNPGQEYAYQYMIDGQLKVADAFSFKILDPSNDPFIAAAVYPNLKPYPTGKTTGIVSVLQTNQPEYPWRNTNFIRPNPRDLVAYELHVRDFSVERTFQRVIDSLSYLKRLGINCLKLMPTTEFEGNNSWGYNPMFMLASDKAYGRETKLKELIDSCHSLGISVVLDMVLNHQFGLSPIVRMWWNSAANQPAANSPYFNPVAKHDFNVGYDMNHESPATQRFVRRVLKHWLQEYRFDGYRFDLSKGFTQRNTLGNTGLWGQYDSTRIRIWKGIYDSVRVYDPTAYLILEHFADNSEERELANYGLMFWGNLNYNFNEGTMGYVNNSNFQWGAYTQRGWSQPNLMTYAESHDEERLMYRNLTNGSFNATHNTRNIQTALRRMELVPVFEMSIPGPKMIWQFGELGYDFSINRCSNGSINQSCRTDPKPVRWDYFTNPDRRRLFNIYAAMNQLKTTEPAFGTANFTFALSGTFKQIRLLHPSMNVMVYGNWGITDASFPATFPSTGRWYEYFTGDSIDITQVTNTVQVEAGGYRLYTSRRLSAPNLALSDPGTTQSELRSGLHIYPNPSSDRAIIERSEDQSGTPASLEVRNVQGQLLSCLRMEAGQSVLEWNLQSAAGHALPSGLYLISINGTGHGRLVIRR